MIGILLQQFLQPLDRLSVVALVSLHQRQVIVGCQLIGLQSNALGQMARGVRKMAFQVQDRSERILQLRILRLPRNQFLHDRLGRIELLFSNLGGSERVLIGEIIRPQAACLGQRGLGVV